MATTYLRTTCNVVLSNYMTASICNWRITKRETPLLSRYEVCCFEVGDFQIRNQSGRQKQWQQQQPPICRPSHLPRHDQLTRPSYPRSRYAAKKSSDEIVWQRRSYVGGPEKLTVRLLFCPLEGATNRPRVSLSFRPELLFSNRAPKPSISQNVLIQEATLERTCSDRSLGAVVDR